MLKSDVCQSDLVGRDSGIVFGVDVGGVEVDEWLAEHDSLAVSSSIAAGARAGVVCGGGDAGSSVLARLRVAEVDHWQGRWLDGVLAPQRAGTFDRLILISVDDLILTCDDASFRFLLLTPWMVSQKSPVYPGWHWQMIPPPVALRHIPPLWQG